MATTPNLTDEQMTAQFLAFCRSKPADEAYEYCDPDKCAFAQFLRKSGYAKKPSVSFLGWFDAAIETGEKAKPMPAGLEDAVLCRLRNFGRLADRLAALASEPTQ